MFLGLKLVKPKSVKDVLKDESNDDTNIFRYGESHISIHKRAYYPVTFCRAENGRISFGYGSQESQTVRDEFLLGTFDPHAMSLQLARDVFCTLPLFYYLSSELCLVSDDFNWVVEQSPSLTLNKLALSNLLNKPDINSQTLFSEIQLLTDQTRLLWQPDKFETRQAKSMVPDMSMSSQADAHDFKANLEATLEHYWELASDDQTSLAFEVSGGIDSATMPLFIAKRHKPSVLIASMRFIEGFQVTQDQKIAELSDYCQAEVPRVEIDKNTDYPLARFFEPQYSPKPFYQYQEIYSEALTKLARKLKSRGVAIVFTGIGGDELFENNVDSSNRPMADAAFFAGQSRNKLYIDEGVWPIAPLADPALRAYCQALDVVYRSDKNILRAYHEASGFPASIYHPVQNEHFGRFFEDSVRENYQNVLNALATNSQLKKLGYGDSANYMETYNSARWREGAGDDLFKVFRTATAEIILQASAQKLKQPAVS